MLFRSGVRVLKRTIIDIKDKCYFVNGSINIYLNYYLLNYILYTKIKAIYLPAMP